MQNQVNRSLKKISKGAALVLVGTFVGMALALASRVIIVRNITQEEYGILSLVLVISTMFCAFAALGLKPGITRHVAYYRARKDRSKVLGTVLSGIQIALAAGIIFFCILFFGANAIAKIFNNPSLAEPLRIYAFSIPFVLLLNIFLSIYRGLQRADIKVLFQNFLERGILLLGLGFVALVGFSLTNIIYAYLAAAITSFVLLALYSKNKFLRVLRKHKPFPMNRTLLLFSLPLLIRTFRQQIVSWSDVLMLGFFKEEATVGVYNAALPLASYIPIFLTAAIYLYVPLATEAHSKNQSTLLNRNYIILTKWVFALTLPLFLLLFLFPAQILELLYGKEYILASTLLSILSLGYLIHSFLGPNGATLMVLGKTRFLMFASIATIIINIFLNTILIPSYGFMGAAIASSASLASMNILTSIKLYASARIHPFSKNYLKPIFVSVILILIVYIVIKNTVSINYWMLPVFLVIFVIIYGVSLLFTKSFDKEDLMMLSILERKSKLNLSFFKKIINKFL